MEEKIVKTPFSLGKLFMANFMISACTFGGGFVIVTFMKKKYADELHWLEEDEMLDMVALAQSVPGPIAINTSILVGWKMAGFIGMVVSVLGTIIPPIAIISVVAYLYSAFIENKYVNLLLKGMQAGVAAIIVGVVYDMAKKTIKSKDIVQIVLMIVAFIAVCFLNTSVLYVILGAALVGVCRTLIRRAA